MKSGGYRRGGRGSGANHAQNSCHKQNLNMGTGPSKMGKPMRTLNPPMGGKWKTTGGVKRPVDFST